MIKRIKAAIAAWLAEPATLRFFFCLLRLLRPNLRLGNLVFVTLHRHVSETLEKSDIYGVGGIYAEKMWETTGDFFLGIDEDERYRAEQGVARAAVRPEDLALLRSIVGETARARIAEHRLAQRLDAVSEYSRPIALAIVEQYLGVPSGAPEFTRWMRLIFWGIFLNIQNDREVAAATAEAAPALHAYLVALIAEEARKIAAGERRPDTVLTRLISSQLATGGVDEDLTRRTIGGLIVGAVETTSKAIIFVLDELLRRPEQWHAARAAAMAGDENLLQGFVLEALRFNPHNPMIFRRSRAAVALGENWFTRVRLRPNMLVVACTLSAMFDRAAFARPGAFDPRRPRTGYMCFGWGRHTCFAQHINLVTVPEALSHLLRLEGVRLKTAIKYEGTFPESATVTFQTEELR